MAQFDDKYLPITKEALQQIPESLKAAPRWLCWGGEKVPVTVWKNSGGYHSGANVTSPEIWGSFADAVSAIGEECYVKSTEEYFHVVGVGFVVGDGWFCADLDGGQAHGGKEDVPESAIKAALEQTRTYAERSVSGCGFHVFGKCDFSTSEAENNKPHRDAAGKPVPESYEVEFFTRRKFIAITGNRVPEANTDAIECSSGANSFYTEFILNDWQRDEAERAEAYRKTVQSAPKNLEEMERFFLMNYPEILSYSDSAHFRRGGKGIKLADGEYSWIGAVKAMQEIGVPYDAIIEWCRRGSNFKSERDVQNVLKSSGGSGKATVASLIRDATENGWKPDPEKLTGEYKEKHDRKKEKESSFADFIEEYNEQTQKAFEAIGIKPSGEMKWKTNPDGSISEVINRETGEVIYSAAVSSDAKHSDLLGNGTVRTAAPAKAAAQAPEAERLTVSGFDDVEIKEIDYLFFPWFPRGRITAIQGDSGSSKSTFMYAVGAKVSTGEDLLGAPCEDPGNVMFITIEDDAADIMIAFLDSGGDLSKLRRVTDREEIAKMDLSPAYADAINRIIKDQKIKLLVLDPLQQFLSGDMNKANETRPQLGRLMNIAAENNICIAFLEHMGKDSKRSALHRGLGSVDIGAATRSILQIVTDPQDDNFKIAFTVKNNTADFHDTQRAIRYQVKDHPVEINSDSGTITISRRRFHGHAEFVETIPKYNESIYTRAKKKAEDEEEGEEKLEDQYEKDPLVLTARELIAENPNGLFIGTTDMIQKITAVCGFCPYDQTRNSVKGIKLRIGKMRVLLMNNDGIQIDLQEGPIFPKPYNWHGELFEPARTKTRGFWLTAIKAKKEGFQQTKI